MPNFTFSTPMTANQLGLNPLSGWQFETVPPMWPRGAVVQLLMRATTAGVRATLNAGSTTVTQRSPVQGGGTAGTTPSSLNTPATTFHAWPGDKLSLALDEILGGTPTVDGIITIEPA